MRIRNLNDMMTPVAPKTLEEWEGIKSELLNNLKFATSIELLKHDAPLDAHIYPAKEYDGFVIETVVVQTLPGFYLAGNIYRPKDISKKYPAVLQPHGHWTKGRIDMQERGMLPTRYANFALRGIVAFVYDMIGYNDTNQIPHNGYNHEYEKYNYGRFSLQFNNSIKALDFVESLPYVDKVRIGCTGCSGGGTQTYFLTAYDKRIMASAPINMSSVKMQGGCICENITFLRTDYCNVDYTMMAAPRYLFMAASDGDWTVHSQEIEFPAMKKIYALYHAEDRFVPYYRSAPHCYEKCTREQVYKFFCKAFGITDPYDGEVDIEVDILSLTIGGIPDYIGKIKDEAELFEVAKGIIKSNLAKLSDEEKAKIARRVYALDRDYCLDISYIVTEIDAQNGKTTIKLGECPKNTEDMGIEYYHTYNIADDAKRVSGLVNLMNAYPNAYFSASGKTAALVEIAAKYANPVNLQLDAVDASGVFIPGCALVSCNNL